MYNNYGGLFLYPFLNLTYPCRNIFLIVKNKNKALQEQRCNFKTHYEERKY